MQLSFGGEKKSLTVLEAVMLGLEDRQRCKGKNRPGGCAGGAAAEPKDGNPAFTKRDHRTELMVLMQEKTK